MAANVTTTVNCPIPNETVTTLSYSGVASIVLLGQNTGLTFNCETSLAEPLCTIEDMPYDTYTITVTSDCEAPAVASYTCNGVTNGTGNFSVTTDSGTPNIVVTVDCI